MKLSFEKFNETDYIVNLAEAIANGLLLEEFELFCFINDVQQCNATLLMFLNQQRLRKCENKSAFSNRCFFVVKFQDIFGNQTSLEETNEVQARKLLAIFQRKTKAELYKSTGGVLEKIA